MTINAKRITPDQQANAEKIKRSAQETTEAIKKAGDDLRTKWAKEQREEYSSLLKSSYLRFR